MVHAAEFRDDARHRRTDDGLADRGNEHPEHQADEDAPARRVEVELRSGSRGRGGHHARVGQKVQSLQSFAYSAGIVVGMSVAVDTAVEPEEGLRERKKRETRLAVIGLPWSWPSSSGWTG